MADFVRYDPATGNVLGYEPSLNTPEYEGLAGYLKIARADAENLKRLASPNRWMVEKGAVREMTAQEKADADAAETLAASTNFKAAEEAKLDAGTINRATLSALLPVVNDLRARNLQSAWTLDDLVAEVKSKVGT